MILSNTQSPNPLKVTAIAELRQYLHDWRQQGERIALVATMGNLHDGHLSLVDIARLQASRVVVSIFVNPTQFVAGEDFAAYPRSLNEDIERLGRVRTDLLFAPDVDTLYPANLGQPCRIEVPALDNDLCGAVRPGHFSGVATVVCKLFNLIQPDVAVFGEKDYQQLLVIRRLVSDLCMPIEIIGAPIVREADGLAMSSRNRYLSGEERQRAAGLHACLQQVSTALQAGDKQVEQILSAGLEQLKQAGFEPDYLQLRRAADLRPVQAGDSALRLLVAARLGKARLIDNVAVQYAVAGD